MVGSYVALTDIFFGRFGIRDHVLQYLLKNLSTLVRCEVEKTTFSRLQESLSKHLHVAILACEALRSRHIRQMQHENNEGLTEVLVNF